MSYDYQIFVLIFTLPNFILMAFIKKLQFIYFLICFFIKTQEHKAWSFFPFFLPFSISALNLNLTASSTSLILNVDEGNDLIAVEPQRLEQLLWEGKPSPLEGILPVSVYTDWCSVEVYDGCGCGAETHRRMGWSNPWCPDTLTLSTYEIAQGMRTWPRH